MNNGYVYVASMSSAYYRAAVRSADSLKDHYPDAKITLFTHPEFFNEKDRKLFDRVYLDIPYHIRAKMYGMYNSPYDKTLYIDADTEIRSEKIKDVFNLLGDKDIIFTRIIPHVSKSRKIDDDNELEYHGGIILYNNKKTTISLIKEWYELYLYQRSTAWENSIFKQFDKGMKPWDQFTVWYLLNKEERHKEVKHGFFPDGGVSYNYIYVLEFNSMKKNLPYRNIEQIIYHYTIPPEQVNAGRLKNKS